jgi:uncharacterized membrane protein
MSPDEPKEEQTTPREQDPPPYATAAQLAALTLRVHQLEQALALTPRPEPAPPPAAPAPPALYPLPPTPSPLPPPPPPRSLEDRLGSQVFNRVGIIAVLIGATWFLKWAMDNHWIGPLGRILIGLAAGAALIAWSKRFRRQNFKAFAWSMKALGSGILYLSLWAAFQLYHLMPAPAAFAAMLAVTAFNTYLAWAQDAEILAAYAAAGGFLTPALLATGEDHAIFLFSYLLTLNAAILALVRLRNWPRLLLATYPATVAYYTLWYFSVRTPSDDTLAPIFLLLFFALFTTPTITLDRNQQPAPILDILLPLANGLFTGLMLYIQLADNNHKPWAPWIAVTLAALYLALLRIQRSRVASAIHLTLAILFLSLAIPLKASGHWIPLGWLAEATALLWISRRFERSEEDTPASIHRTLRVLATAALTIGFLYLLFLPLWRPYHPESAFLNPRFASTLAGLAALALTTWIATHAPRSRETAQPTYREITWREIAAATIIAFNLLALTAVIEQIQIFWSHALGPDTHLAASLSVSAYLMAYAAALLVLGFSKRSPFLRWQAILLLLAAILKTFLYDIRTLSQGYRVASFLALGALLMAISLAYQKDWFILRTTPKEENPQ